MHRYLISALVLLAASSARADSCSEMRKVNGVLTAVSIPCEQLETPIPCSETTVDAQGRTLITDRPCRPGEQKTIQQVERDERAAKKKACGRDFETLRIGMKLTRFEQCTDGTSFVTETVTKQRVVEVYRSTFYWLHVVDGVIVGYTRRTR